MQPDEQTSGKNAPSNNAPHDNTKRSPEIDPKPVGQATSQTSIRNAVIFGATSAIAQAVTRSLAQRHCQLVLVGRHEQRLQALADDLMLRGAKAVSIITQDLSEHTLEYDQLTANVLAQLDGPLDLALIAHGTLPDQATVQATHQATFDAIQLNALSYIGLLTVLANTCEAQGHGTLVAISSVAGDRGRQSNYVYGSAKGMITLFCQGLRNRLAKSNVHVITVKPGFTDTPMTADFPKGPLWAKPEQVAAGILTAIDKQKDIVYLPGFWKYIMLIIRHIPEFIFKRLKL